MKRYIVPKWQVPGAEGEVFDLLTSASLAGVPSRTLLKYWKLGLIRPIGDVDRYGIFFDQEAIYLALEAEVIRHELKVDMRAATVIVRLRQEVKCLREELQFWRRK